MISDKKYYELMKIGPDGTNKDKSLIRNYIDSKGEQKTDFDLLSEFNANLRETIGIPDNGNPIKGLKKPKSEKDALNVHYGNITKVTETVAFALNDLLRQHGLTREKIARLTLSDYRNMCQKTYGKNSPVPSQEMLDRFKKFTKNLSITDVDLMKYAARFTLVTDFQFRNLTESEMWMKITEGKQIPEPINKYIEKGIKAFNQSVSDVNMAQALHVTLGVTTYGTLALWEAVSNATNPAVKDLPKRQLNAKKDVEDVTYDFNGKVENFRNSHSTDEVEFKPVTTAKKEKVIEYELEPEIVEDTHNLVPIKFNSEKEFLQGLMMNNINENTVIDFKNFTIFKEPLHEFDTVDKKDNQSQASDAPIRIHNNEEVIL